MITLAIETSCDETAICILETKEPFLEYRILANVVHSQIELHKQYGGVFPIMAKREHARNIMPLIEAAFTQAKISTELIGATRSTNENTSIENQITGILKEKEPELLAALIASPLFKQKPMSGHGGGRGNSGGTANNIDRIAVTRGPGLEPALWVGVNLARALGILWNIPVIGVNHMEGHIVGSLLPSSELSADFKKIYEPALPALSLLISGGHTELVLVEKNLPTRDVPAQDANTSIAPPQNAPALKYTVVGRTLDDALGEAFDKTARMLGLPYPGGPEISKLAEKARTTVGKGAASIDVKPFTLPRPMIHSKNLDFSFSGLKTAVLYLIRELTKGDAHPASNASRAPSTSNASNISTEPKQLSGTTKAEIAREFEDAVTEVIISKTEKAIEQYSARSLIVGGGVIANRHILSAVNNLAAKHSLTLYTPPQGVSGDNALMIALASHFSPSFTYNNDKNVTNSFSDIPFRAQGNLSW